MAKATLSVAVASGHYATDGRCPTCQTLLKVQTRNEPTGGTLYTPQRRTVCPKHGTVTDWTATGSAFTPETGK